MQQLRGWMDVAHGSLQLAYLDLSTPHLFPPCAALPPDVEPHYTSHAALAFAALTRQDGDRPDLVYLKDSSGTAVSPFVAHAASRFLWPCWTGSLLVHQVKACASLARCWAKLVEGLTGLEPATW